LPVTTRFRLAARSGGDGFDASSAPLEASSLAVLLRSRRSPGAVPRRAMPRLYGGSRRPGVPGHRPGRLAARRLRGAGQIDRGVSPAVSLASLRRSLAAPCRPGLPASGPSRFGVLCDACGTQAVVVASPLRFFASRCLASPRALIELCVSARRSRSPVAPVWETPPERVIRAWCSSGSARSGPAPGLFSRPGRCRRSVSPATSVGFAHHPSQS
jgi:hypothetical protein